ncbi:KH domain-containing protein [Campylobacter ureolyticus]|uniref:KH domain-containing protein n=1 Tax=Campylobacter ureolyticus TaxID=827 RepID=A0A6N2TL49_9BACT
MVEEFIRQYALLICEYPEKIKIEKIKIDDNFYEIIIYVDKTDTGKLIGKDGKMINAIRTVVLGYKAKDSVSYKFSVKALEE